MQIKPALACTLVLSAAIWSPAGAVLQLGEQETPIAVLFKTSGKYMLVDADNDGVRETIQFTADQGITQGSLQLWTIDAATVQPSFYTADPVDPFWGTRFFYGSVKLDPVTIPVSGDLANVNCLGGYGPDESFAGSYATSSQLLSAFLLPVTPAPCVIMFNGTSATIDSSQLVSAGGTPAPGGWWISDDGDDIPDTGLEDLLKDSSVPVGRYSLKLEGNCPLLDYARGACEPTERTRNATATLVLPLPGFTQPESCDLDSDGNFKRNDLKLFREVCKGNEPIYDCDVNGDGKYSTSDVVNFFLGCKIGQ